MERPDSGTPGGTGANGTNSGRFDWYVQNRRRAQESPGEEDAYNRPAWDDYEEPSAGEEPEPLRRELAQYAFLREEDEREVRLLFRDVPADEIAAAFRRAGATLISITGERAVTLPAAGAAGRQETPEPQDLDEEGAAGPVAEASGTRYGHPAHRRQAGTQAKQSTRTGEPTLRYFFALGDIVYTVSIVSPAGIIESIASIYPAAQLSEHELRDRLAVIFRNRHRPTGPAQP